VAQYNSAVTSKTPTWSRAARQLFLKKRWQCITQPVLHVNARTKCDSAITSHYSGVASKNNDNTGNEYKLSIDYKRAMEKKKKDTQNKPNFSSIY
jgi:hypothetical protein